MKAVIMAGGFGTRMSGFAPDIPKPMIRILDKPVLEYQIECLKENGITDIILVTGYKGEQIREYFGDGADFGVDITYFEETRPLGTAGSLYYLKNKLDGDFILIMGDLMLSVDFERFIAAHRKTGATVTLFVHPSSHPSDSDIIVTDEVGRLEDFTEDKRGENVPIEPGGAVFSKPVTGFIRKNSQGTLTGADSYVHNQVNAGIYAVSVRALSAVPCPGDEKIDLDRDLIMPLVKTGGVYAYKSTEYVKDMGTPERYAEAAQALRSGQIEARNLKNKQKCVFLDRDGTLNVEKGFLSDVNEMELTDGAAEALKRINDSEYLAVVITNQPVIARGECTFEEEDLILRKFETLLGRGRAYVDDVFYCPHHTDRGFRGEVKELKFKCRCRKGKPGMVLEAAAKLNIDLENSWIIGDKTSDLQCGMSVGTRGILLLSGAAGRDGRYDITPDYTARDITEAVGLILGED